ncbi:MAG: transporter substrate-binding domain-containing protein [Bacteroidales bacterium]|nr:transporter substrate-binding domain-containing protein [Bacteroidales bacterium]
MKTNLLIISLILYPLLIISQNDTIVVGGDYNYPPYSFIDEDGKEAGFDVDIINAIAKECDFQVEFVFDRWDSTLNRLERGDIDVLASVVYSESREIIYDFTFHLHTEYYAIFARKETKIIDVYDLQSKKAAFLTGDISNEVFIKPMGLLSDTLMVKSFPEAFLKIQLDLCDYVVVPYPLGMKIIKEQKLKNIEVKGPAIIPSVYCLAVKEGNSKLLATLNTGIENLSRNGELDRIYNKWVKFKREDDQYKSWFKYVLFISGGLVVIVLILILFWNSLRRQVLRKTMQINDAKEIYQKVFNSVEEVLVVMDKKGIVIDANRKALELYNKELNQIRGMIYTDIISSNNIELFENALKEVESDDFYFSGEVSREENVKLSYLEVKGLKIVLEKEDLYMVVLHDITDKKSHLIKLQDAKKIEEEANSAKSIFLSTISHEIRTPLNAIIGYSTQLGKTTLSSKQSDYINKINISGNVLLNLVNDVLDITKIEAGKLEIRNEPFSIRELVNKIYNVEKFKMDEKNLDFVLEISPEIPDVLIGDELRLTQVLLNLLNNAVKFTHKGQVSFFVKKDCEKGKNKTNCINFSIKDSGIGISIDKQKTLFEPFVQAQNNNRKYGGTGLGLSISKKLVNLMGGDINLESDEGKGATFNVSIPFAIGTKKQLKAEINEKSGIKNHSLKGISVLLVEDNLFNAEILTEQLKEEKINVTHAASGKEAIAYFKTGKFDIILMDIEMPEMNGFETTLKIKQINKPQIPIIALSAHSLDSEKETAMEIGMTDYLSKPIVYKDLINEMGKHINLSIEEQKQTVNFDEGLINFDNREGLYRSSLLRFRDLYEKKLNELSDPTNYNISSLQFFTHNLKSDAKMIGANKLSIIAKNCDDILRKNTELLTKEEVILLFSATKSVIKDISHH